LLHSFVDERVQLPVTLGLFVAFLEFRLLSFHTLDFTRAMQRTRVNHLFEVRSVDCEFLAGHDCDLVAGVPLVIAPEAEPELLETEAIAEGEGAVGEGVYTSSSLDGPAGTSNGWPRGEPDFDKLNQRTEQIQRDYPGLVGSDLADFAGPYLNARTIGWGAGTIIALGVGYALVDNVSELVDDLKSLNALVKASSSDTQSQPYVTNRP
jgi:hypothetical protein